MSAVVYGGFKPHPSLLMLRHPFAGHALVLGNLVGGLLLALTRQKMTRLQRWPRLACDTIDTCLAHSTGAAAGV